MNASQHATLDMLQAQLQSNDPEITVEASGKGVKISFAAERLSFHHSFVSGPLAQRAGQSNQMLLKACNNKQRNLLKVLDLTAGWGADSFMLASAGQDVMLLEQNALVYATLAYSLALLETHETGADAANHMTVMHVNALDYLRALPPDHDFDCMFLDPMFPARKSSAKPAKEMQILQALTDNLEIDACFELALQKAHKRVVVKRPAKAVALNDLKPDLSYREKTVRFDVFLTA